MKTMVRFKKESGRKRYVAYITSNVSIVDNDVPNVNDDEVITNIRDKASSKRNEIKLLVRVLKQEPFHQIINELINRMNIEKLSCDILNGVAIPPKQTIQYIRNHCK